MQGQSPTSKRIRYTPQSADPVNPAEGDTYFSDGTPRAEGLWTYKNGEWTSAGGGDLQTEVFEFKPYINVRAASTANLSIATELEAGDTVDGVVLAAGDLVLLKNQTTASQNGIYLVPASGAAGRYTGADTVDELSYASVAVLEGTTLARSIWFQNNLLADLSDAQSWASAPAVRTFTVPQDKVVLWVQMAGGGGAGGSGGRLSGDTHGGGGSGGCGVNPIEFTIPVTPGEIISMVLGKGGIPSPVQNTDFVLGGDGSFTTLTYALGALFIGGGLGGMGGETTANNSGTQPRGGSATGVWSLQTPSVSGGDGGRGAWATSSDFFTSLPGSAGSDSARGNAGVGGVVNGSVVSGKVSSGGGGGGGGAGLEAGGAGGIGGEKLTTNVSTAGANGGRSAGGGGGGGGWKQSFTGGSDWAIGKLGGFGGHGFIRIAY